MGIFWAETLISMPSQKIGPSGIVGMSCRGLNKMMTWPFAISHKVVAIKSLFWAISDVHGQQLLRCQNSFMRFRGLRRLSRSLLSAFNLDNCGMIYSRYLLKYCEMIHLTPILVIVGATCCDSLDIAKFFFLFRCLCWRYGDAFPIATKIDRMSSKRGGEGGFQFAHRSR